MIFTADHGEALGEDDLWFSHGEYLHEASVRVPLLVRVAGRTARRRDDVASLVDILPTALGLFGIGAGNGLPGRDLLGPRADTQPGRAYFSTSRHGARVPRYGLVADGHKLVLSVEAAGPESRLFRLPDEERDVSAEAGALASRLREEIESIRARLLTTIVAPRRGLSPADRDRLRALGYIDDGS